MTKRRRHNTHATTPLAYSVAQACAAAGSSGRSALYQAIRERRLRAVKYGRRTLILAHDLADWLEALPPMQPTQHREDSRAAPTLVGATCGQMRLKKGCNEATQIDVRATHRDRYEWQDESAKHPAPQDAREEGSGE